MYRKKTSSWLKHWDFILLDLILLELSYLLAHWLHHRTGYYREAPLYRNVFFAIAAIDLVVGLMMGSYKGIPFVFEDGGTRVIHYTPETYIPKE